MNFNAKENKEVSKVDSYSATERVKKFKYKSIKIPKLLLNKKLNDFDKSKTHRVIKNMSSNNFIFIENPRKKELSDYYYSKNRSLINDISLNSKRKLNTVKTLEGINDNKLFNIKRKNINIRSRLFDYEINKKNIDKNNINSKKEKNIEKFMNTSFLSSKNDDPLLKYKIRKYLKEKLFERYDLYALVNYPFGKKYKGKSVKFPNIDRKLILKNLTKPKKIDTDIYDTILDEYNNAKSSFNTINDNKNKQIEISEKNLLKNKLNKNKLDKIFKNDFVTNSGKVQKALLDNQVKLMKNKINNSLTNILDFDYINEFNTILYLSLSHSVDQLFNSREYVKYINDNAYIKSSLEQVPNKYIIKKE